MHDSVKDWIGDRVRECSLASLNTLDVGSLDVNGSVRPLFDGPYLGVDMREGPGVDVVTNANRLPFPSGAFEVVVSTEMLEHDARFWLSMAEMGRVLAPGGHLLLTTRGNGFGEHGYPHDFWRFMPDAGALLLEMAGCATVVRELDPEVPGIFLHGLRV